MQIWKIDENGIFTGESYFTKEPLENEITTPLTVGYVKVKWNGEEWIEGATEKEILEWKDNQVVEVELSFEETQLEYNIDLDYRLSLLEMGLI